VNDFLEPLRERRRELEEKPDYVREVLFEGGKRARAIARETIAEVYEKMGLGQPV
ncbi:MAG: tryptophan--tRNA ligase, partial [Chloroflexota bacterium]|nr:tryptophan--tRNA ligase [Chloroflexota bacterium]